MIDSCDVGIVMYVYAHMYGVKKGKCRLSSTTSGQKSAPRSGLSWTTELVKKSTALGYKSTCCTHKLYCNDSVSNHWNLVVPGKFGFISGWQTSKTCQSKVAETRGMQIEHLMLISSKHAWVQQAFCKACQDVGHRTQYMFACLTWGKNKWERFQAFSSISHPVSYSLDTRARVQTFRTRSLGVSTQIAEPGIKMKDMSHAIDHSQSCLSQCTKLQTLTDVRV